MMSSPDKKKGNWKEKLFHEMTEYWINVCYLPSSSPLSHSTEGSFWLHMTSRTPITGLP